MQEKARKDNSEKLQDRMDIRRMAGSQDPFQKNKDRYEDLRNRMNFIHQEREDLFKSTVLNKIVHQKKNFEDKINRSVQLIQTKNQEMADSFLDQRRKNTKEHYDFVKYQAENRKLIQSLQQEKFKKEQMIASQ